MSESGSQGHSDDAMVDLLVKQVTEGLSPAEQRELDAMDRGRVSAELRGFERAAAAATLAGTVRSEPPAALRTLLEQHADRYFAGGNVLAFKGGASAGAPAGATAADAAPAVRGARGGAWGWLAAAACLLLAIAGWLRSPVATVPAPVAANAPLEIPPAPPAVPPAAPPTPAEQRDAMLARADTVKVRLAPTKDAAAIGVSGDVVWDPSSQQGFVHFVGLASNDPAVRQYQIWIFDAKRDKRYPVDCGVFDVPATSAEVVIPIHAALPISLAKAFAVTVEKPGGVVVSALGHVVAMGAAG